MLKDKVSRNNGKQIITASEDQTIIFWDENFTIKKVYRGTSAYHKLIYLRKSNNICAGNEDGDIEILDRNTALRIFVLNANNNNYSALLELTSEELIIESDKGTLKLWNSWKHNYSLRRFQGHNDYIRCLIQHSSGVMLSGSDDQTICVWNTTNGKLLRTVRHEARLTDIYELLGSWNILSICSGSPGSSIKIWDLIHGTTIYNAPHPQIEPSGFRSSYLYNQGLLMLGGYRGNLVIFELETKQYIQSYKLHELCITQICMLNDIQLLTATCYDNTINISNWKTGNILRSIKQQEDCITSILILDDVIK